MYYGLAPARRRKDRPAQPPPGAVGNRAGRRIPGQDSPRTRHRPNPNPFNPNTNIRFDISANQASEHIRLEIFDLLGRKVRTLASGQYAPGTYSLLWNATDDAGLPVASGIYVYRLSSPSTSVTKKMVLIQ